MSVTPPISGNAPDVLTPASNNYLPNMYAYLPYLTSQCYIQFQSNKTQPGSQGNPPGQQLPSGAYYADSNNQALFLVEMQDMGNIDFIPFLTTNYGLWVEQDIYTYGAIMTQSDPYKSVSPGTGGGAIMIGHGFYTTTTPPCIIVADTNYSTLYLYTDAETGALANLAAGTLIAENTTIAQFSDWTTISNTNDKGVLLNYNTGTQKTNGSWSAFQIFDGLTTQILGLTYTGALGAVDVNPLGGADTGGVGGGSNYWAGMCAYEYYGYILSIQSLDAFDDLNLIKNYKTKKVTRKGIEKEIVDLDTLSILKSTDADKANFYEAGKMHGLAFGALKQTALKFDEQAVINDKIREELDEAKLEIDNLHSQVDDLRAKLRN